MLFMIYYHSVYILFESWFRLNPTRKILGLLPVGTALTEGFFEYE